MTNWKYCPECTKPLQSIIGQDKVERPTCPDGHFTHYNNPDAAAGAIVRKNGKYLVLRRAINPAKGEWELPGGFIKSGETAEETVVREVQEETGLTTKIIRCLGTTSGQYGDTGITVIAVAFLVDVVDGTLKLSHENSEHRWVGIDEFPPMGLEGDQKKVDMFRTTEKKTR